MINLINLASELKFAKKHLILMNQTTKKYFNAFRIWLGQINLVMQVH